MKTIAIYFLYRCLQALASPLLLLYVGWRAVRQPAYWRTLPQRFGFLPRAWRQEIPGSIWLHAVSVGEVVAAVELARQLRARFPRSPLFVSVSTLAGRATAEQKLANIAAGIFYAPLDYVFAVRRVLRTLQPALVLVLETEIWPNLFRETKRTGAGLLLANGRISDRAFPRYCRLRPFFSHVLRHAGAILAQSPEMRRRFIEIGAPEALVTDGGNLKYDFRPLPAPAGSPVRALIERIRPGRVWIAASTMPPARPEDPDEDDAVIAAFRNLAASHRDLLLILAPRRPERFDTAAQKLAEAGIPFLRRSALRPGDTLALPGVLLLDTIGELAGVFFLGDVVFMGGTLASRGGHNILEPALAAKPVVVGPHMENFREIADAFKAAGASVEIGSPDELPAAVGRLLGDPGDTGARALACAEARRGATARAVEAAAAVLAVSLPCRRPTLPAIILLGPLALLWDWGGRLKRRLTKSRALPAPVVSVGNVTMGGTGKTPFVLLVARCLHAAGLRPGILTRGYGRHFPDKYLALAAGQSVPREMTGDEPQIFLRSGIAAVGIGPDRYRAGRLVNDSANVFILDDGFQHARLARCLDIVLIDALDPFGGCRAFPLGRLREPLRALARAGLFVITRSDYGRVVDAIEHHLHRHNPAAPVLRARVVPETWVECATGRSVGIELPPAKIAAFCGLGNPQSFWCTLETLGLKPVEQIAFEDHHIYRPHELRRMAHQFLAAGAELVVTTEKDSLNFSPESESLLAPLRLYWLRIRMEVEPEAGLLKALESVQGSVAHVRNHLP